MADGVFNIAKGMVNEYTDRINGNDPTNSAYIVVLLTVNEADATLEDYDDLATLLAASNTEAAFTNYARKTLDDGDMSASVVDDTNNRKESSLPAITWSSAGGASNETTTKLLVCYDSDTTSGTDSNIIPVSHHDFSYTTTGIDLVTVAGVFFRAS